MFLPESLDCEMDLRQAERQRPSVEATTAQKGVGRWIALLNSALTVTEGALKDKPVIVVNLTGYVEDVGVAVPRPVSNETRWRVKLFNLVCGI